MKYYDLKLPSGDIISFTTADVGQYIDQTVNIEDFITWIQENYSLSHFRIYVLFEDESINYEIPNEDILLGGSYNENYQNGQRRTLSFSLYNNEGKYTPGINNLWAGTKIAYETGIEFLDGSLIWFRKGIYSITKLDPQLSSSQSVVQVSANDKFSLFENKTGVLDTSYEIPAGSDIEEIIQSIILTNSGSGTPLDPKPIIYHSSFKGKKTQIAISKNAGETLGSVLLDLATQLSAEIFYNSAGQLTLVPNNEISQDSDKPLLGIFSFDKAEFENLNFSFDLAAIVNKIIVIGSGNSGGVSRAVAVNDDPGSPLCYQRIGYRTGEIINDSNITSDVLAEERAKYELRSQLILKSSTSIEVLFNPLLEVNNLIAINCEFYDLKLSKFIIQSVSFNIDYNGTMNLSISNLKNIKSLTR